MFSLPSNSHTSWLLGLGLPMSWLITNVGDIACIYFYARAVGNPVPRTTINRNSHGWSAYIAFMYFGGVVTSFMNGYFWQLYYSRAHDWYRQRNCEPYRNQDAGPVSNVLNYPTMTRLFLSKFLVRWWYQVHLFVVFPIVIITIVGPSFGPLVARAVVNWRTWDHRCDSFPVEVVLDGLSHNAPKSQVPLASFFFWENGVRIKYYEYSLSKDDIASNLWHFNLHRVEPHAPAAVYPTVWNVSYQLVNNTVSAHCAMGPETPASATTECMHGTFDPGRRLAFSLSDTRIPTNMTTKLRAIEDDWLFYKGAPRFILREVPLNRLNELGDIMVQTVVTRPGQCRSLKVCLAREVGLETITPLGLALLKQNDYADKCTKLGMIQYYRIYYYYYD